MSIKTVLPILLILAGCANNPSTQTNKPADSQTASNQLQVAETMSFIDIKKSDGKVVRLLESKTSDDFISNLKKITDNEILIEKSAAEVTTLKFLLQATEISIRESLVDQQPSFLGISGLSESSLKLGINIRAFSKDSKTTKKNGSIKMTFSDEKKGIFIDNWEAHFGKPTRFENVDIPKNFKPPTHPNGLPVHVSFFSLRPATHSKGNHVFYYEQESKSVKTSIVVTTGDAGYLRDFSITQTEK